MAIRAEPETVEYYSPLAYVERARRLMGEIDLDPASCTAANDTVRAKRIYTMRDDGLSKRWEGRVYLNPPGGKLVCEGKRWVRPKPFGQGKSSMAIWWNRLTEDWQLGKVEQAVFVGFTLEILRTSQQASLPVQAFPRCCPAKRLRFGGEGTKHPHASNLLVFLPPKRGPGFEAFRDVFGDLGVCERGYL